MCQVNGRTASTSYTVLTGNAFAVIVVEMVDQTDAKATPEIKQPFNAELLASFPAHSASPVSPATASGR